MQQQREYKHISRYVFAVHTYTRMLPVAMATKPMHIFENCIKVHNYPKTVPNVTLKYVQIV